MFTLLKSVLMPGTTSHASIYCCLGGFYREYFRLNYGVTIAELQDEQFWVDHEDAREMLMEMYSYRGTFGD